MTATGAEEDAKADDAKADGGADGANGEDGEEESEEPVWEPDGANIHERFGTQIEIGEAEAKTCEQPEGPETFHQNAQPAVRGRRMSGETVRRIDREMHNEVGDFAKVALYSVGLEGVGSEISESVVPPIASHPQRDGGEAEEKGQDRKSVEDSPPHPHILPRMKKPGAGRRIVQIRNDYGFEAGSGGGLTSLVFRVASVASKALASGR